MVHEPREQPLVSHFRKDHNRRQSRLPLAFRQFLDLKRNVHVAYIVAGANNDRAGMKSAGERQDVGAGGIALDQGNPKLVANRAVPGGVVGTIDHDDFFARRKHVPDTLHSGLAQSAHNDVALHSASPRGPDVVTDRARNNLYCRKESTDEQDRFPAQLRDQQKFIGRYGTATRRLEASKQDSNRRDRPALPIAIAQTGMSQRGDGQNNNNQSRNNDGNEVAGSKHQAVTE